MLGVELVTDRQLKTPAKAEILHIMDQMRGGGVCVCVCVHVSVYMLNVGLIDLH